MPELPEVETTCQGIERLLKGQRIQALQIRESRLRWPVSAGLSKMLKSAVVQKVGRRGKYLLLETTAGTAILHLGMSGSLRVVTDQVIPSKHDHVDFRFDNGAILRFRDPRRFGAILWGGQHPLLHPLLCDLGVEPLTADFDADYLFQRSRRRKTSIKQFVMDAGIVVGIGNIYANESLFRAGVRPGRAAGKLSLADCINLVAASKQVLLEAIRAGGTTLRDFAQSDGRPGYFSQELSVYGRTDEPCLVCETKIKTKRIGQRASFYCPNCQPH